MYVPIPYILLSMTDFCSDHAYLQHYEGMDKNSLNKIFLQYDINRDDTNEADIMSNSSYYDIDDFIKLTMNYSEQFSIFNSNIESINAKFNELPSIN